MRKIVYLCSICILVSVYSCQNNNSQEKDSLQKVRDSINEIINSPSVIDTVALQKAIEAGNWEYSESEDKMTSKKEYYATIKAEEILNFDFPYNGGSIASFTIRKDASNSTNIYLQVSKGQFNSSYDGSTVRIRFDKNPPKTYSTSEASDGSSDIIFINSVKDIINRLKKSETMIIEVEFYNEGNRLIEFDITGLKWAR